jgi:hypothetical protein
MASIRILSIPPGEAPEDIREAWIGLSLPLAGWPLNRRRNWRVGGVLSGQKSVLAHWVSFIFGKAKKMDGYAVNGQLAITELEKKNPTAAAWWMQNVPRCVKPHWALVFPEDVCELESSSE